jgi:hypothetical protein
VTKKLETPRPEQVVTVPTTTAAIMSHPDFELGVADRRTGRPMPPLCDSWDYERGRLWACLAPVDLALHIGGRLNPRAVALYDAACLRKYIL